MKRLILPIVALLLCGGVSRAAVLRQTHPVTATTNAAFGSAIPCAGGVLQRLVVVFPAGLTNLSVQAVDGDGTTLVSTNFNNAAGSNAAWSATWTGPLYSGGFAFSTKSALRVATNGSLSVILHSTVEQ